MRTVQEHLNACLQLVEPLPPLDVLLPDTVGCVLAEDVTAAFDRPVADVAACDGYAVRSEDVAAASPDTAVTLKCVADLRPGDTDPVSVIPDGCVRIASGAPLPVNADAVVPLDDTDGGEAETAIYRAVSPRENVRPQAEDVSAHQVVLKSGSRIGARQVALLGAVGRLRVRVHPRPRVVIISIGDELVEPGQPGSTGTVFDANSHALSTAAADAGAETFRVSAVPDERQALQETIEDQLVRADLILTTGGLSYGAADTVREVLSNTGTVRFDRVAIWPGRTFGLGKVGDDGTPIFCLPGDPVAAQIGYEIFVRSALRKMAGWTDLFRPSIRARLEHGWKSTAGIREFVPVILSGSPAEGYRAAVPEDPHALRLSTLSAANALAVVPEEVTEVVAGQEYYCMVLD